MSEISAGGRQGYPPPVPRAGPHPSLRVEGPHAIVISAQDGHEFRIDADFAVHPFLLVLDGHRISTHTAHLLARALTSMAYAVHDDRSTASGSVTSPKEPR